MTGRLPITHKQQSAEALAAQAEKSDQPPSHRDALRQQADELHTQAEELARHWGPGGHCRQIMTALLAGACGNVTGSSAAFLQGSVVNFIQQNLAQEIGKLVAEGQLTEGSPCHASLHALIAAAGAAVIGQDITSAAAGGAAASLLTHLFDPPAPDAREEERTAKRHLITTLVAGIAATVEGDVTAATSAALVNVDNNWLASQQRAQMARELAAANTLVEELKVIARWGVISCDQDLATLSGIADGMVDAGIEELSGMIDFIRHPIEGLKGIRKLISEPEVFNQLGEQLHGYLAKKLDNMTTALREGGRENAWQLGHDMGEVTLHALSAVTGALRTAKGCTALGKVGIKITRKGAATAKALQAMGAGAAVRKASETVARLPGTVAKSSQRVLEVIKKGLRPGATRHRTVSLRESGITWGGDIHAQGFPWENYYATQVAADARLPAGFKTFDFFDKSTGVATSAKTMDTGTAATKIANPKQLYYTMKSNMIDPIINFKEYELCEIAVTESEILRRELQLAIPYNTTSVQWEQINRGIDYAQLNGIHVEITLVKP